VLKRIDNLGGIMRTFDARTDVFWSWGENFEKGKDHEKCYRVGKEKP